MCYPIHENIEGGLCMAAKKDLHDYPYMLRVPEVAEVLGISRSGCYNLVKSAGFPALRIGKRLLVPRDALEHWVDDQVKN